MLLISSQVMFKFPSSKYYWQKKNIAETSITFLKNAVTVLVSRIVIFLNVVHWELHVPVKCLITG